MDTNTLIQAEITRIEKEAARQIKMLLAAQDDYVAAHVLLDLLKTHGGNDNLHVTPIYHCAKPAMTIFPDYSTTGTVAAIERAGLNIDLVCEGFNDATTRIILRGYANVEVYVKRSEMEWQVAA